MLFNRRRFIQSSVAGAVLGGAGFAQQAFAADDKRTRIPLYKAVYDERFQESAAFGAEAERLGVQGYAIRGDITDLWFHDLDARWRQDRAPVAGLTTEASLFCLEHLARDHRMRIVYQGEHAFTRSGRALHSFPCSEAALDYAKALGRTNPREWAPPLARLVADRSCLATVGKALTGPPAPARPDSKLLVSWIIAPVPTLIVPSRERKLEHDETASRRSRE